MLNMLKKSKIRSSKLNLRQQESLNMSEKGIANKLEYPTAASENNFTIRSFNLESSKPELIIFGKSNYLKYTLKFSEKLHKTSLDYFTKAALISKESSALPLVWEQINEKTFISNISHLKPLAALNLEKSTLKSDYLALSLLAALLELALLYDENYFIACKLALTKDYIFYAPQEAKWYFCLLPVLQQQAKHFLLNEQISYDTYHRSGLEKGQAFAQVKKELAKKTANVSFYQAEFKQLLDFLAARLERQKAQVPLNIFNLWSTIESDPALAIQKIKACLQASPFTDLNFVQQQAVASRLSRDNLAAATNNKRQVKKANERQFWSFLKAE